MTWMDDINDRKKAEENLSASEERFALAMSGSGGGLWDWNVEENQIFVSPDVRFLMGLPEDQKYAGLDDLRERVHPEDFDDYLAAEQAHFEGKTERYEAEYRIRGYDGTYRWVLDQVTAQRDSDGNIVRMNGSYSDVSNRKDAEDELRRSQEAY